MAEQRASRKSRQSKEEDDDTTPQRSENEKVERAERGQRTEKASAITEDVLDDIDRALKEQCGFPHDATISDEEFNTRADVLVKNYVQKSGQ